MSLRAQRARGRRGSHSSNTRARGFRLRQAVTPVGACQLFSWPSARLRAARPLRRRCRRCARDCRPDSRFSRDTAPQVRSPSCGCLQLPREVARFRHVCLARRAGAPCVARSLARSRPPALPPAPALPCCLRVFARHACVRVERGRHGVCAYRITGRGQALRFERSCSAPKRRSRLLRPQGSKTSAATTSAMTGTRCRTTRT